jgi:DNA-binding CsgD family transcriptional regulator
VYAAERAHTIGSMGRSPLGNAAASVHDAIVRLCAGNLAPLELLATVARRVRSVVPYAMAGWLTTDPGTLLHTGAFVEDVPAELHLRLIENELTGNDFAKFAHIARLPQPVLPLSEATDGEPLRSPRRRTLYAPAGYGDELRAAFRAGGVCWGVACLTRSDQDPDFTIAEVDFIASICDHVAHGLRSGLLTKSRDDSPPEPPGLVVLLDDSTVESLTEEAVRWLNQLPTDGLELPSVIYEVAARARSRFSRGGTGPPARARVRLPSGRWLVAHGARLNARGGGPSRTAVMLEPASRSELAPLIVELHDLTEREREVTQLLLRGMPIDQIAHALWISQHTVRDHTKAIFAKLGVSSRPELTAMLYHDRHAPRINALHSGPTSPDVLP